MYVKIYRMVKEELHAKILIDSSSENFDVQCLLTLTSFSFFLSSFPLPSLLLKDCLLLTQKHKYEQTSAIEE